jgi:AraC-like DNA-binding protein
MMMSVRSVQPVTRHLQALGVRVEAVLAQAGTDAAALSNAEGRIPHELAVAIWQSAVRHGRDDAFGIHAAEKIEPGAFDVLDYAMRTSANLGEALERFVRYHRVLHDAAVVRLSLAGRDAVLSHELPDGTPMLPRQVAEFVVAAWVVVARQATGIDFAPREVRFRHARPAELDEHRRFFRAPIRFETPANAIVLSRDLLAAPLLRSDPGLCAILDRQVRQALERLPRSTGLSERVRLIVAEKLTAGEPRVTEIARAVGMSARTLQRQLERDGTMLRELVDTLRRELAVAHLRDTRIPIAEVAFLLGFSEASAFHRAFKRWSGQTPTQFRRSSRN